MSLKDPYFGPELIDLDEWRMDPVPHRYVHGGFKGTDTRFSFYFPPVEQYQGRFLQHLAGGLGGTEHAQGMFSALALAVDCGAYLVESNQGHSAGLVGPGVISPDVNQSIICWRASAETARLSKRFAFDMYGDEPNFGYIFGGSGGGARTLNCIERANIWHGAVPFIVPDPDAIFRLFPIIINGSRILDSAALEKIADAMDVGGSGNPFAGLTEEQTQALLQAYKAGFPRDMPLKNTIAETAFFAFFRTLNPDPSYLDSFWNEPGYLGADNPDEFDDVLIETKTTVTEVLELKDMFEHKLPSASADRHGYGERLQKFLAAARSSMLGGVSSVALSGFRWFRVSEKQLEMLGRSTVTVVSGEAAGQSFDIFGVVGDVLVARTSESSPEPWAAGLAPGDEIRITNRDYLACCHYSRYVAGLDGAESNGLTLNGDAIYPQRDKPAVLVAAPLLHDIGDKKVIMIQNMCDTGALPRFAAEYHDQLNTKIGESSKDHFRLYFIENAPHEPGAIGSRLIDYSGYVGQAVKDLIDWVENGKEPLPSSDFCLTSDNEVLLAHDAATRGGLQPVVRLRANSNVCTRILTGGTVRLDVEIELPPGAGFITAIEWDPLGDGKFSAQADLSGTDEAKIHRQLVWSYDTPGTYFPAVKVRAARNETQNTKLYDLQNLGRVRVIVDEEVAPDLVAP